MKRYEDCIFEGHSPCPSCSLSSYGRDCRCLPAIHLAYLRHVSRMTQKEFAEKIGMKSQQWSAYEVGKNDVRNMRLATAAKVAKVFGMSIDDLYAFCVGDEEPKG